MVTRLKPIDTSQLQTGTVRRRTYRLNVDQLGNVPKPAAPLQEFYQILPKTGHAVQLLQAAELFAQSALDCQPMLWLIDGGLLRAGLSPLLAFLMQRGLIQCLIMNGEAALYDYELAFHGVADEDVTRGVADGLLGLARETGEGINAIINEGVKRGFSIGECLSRGILDRQPKYFTHSLLATGAARLTPTTVHLNIGADGFQRYPGADGSLLGKGSLKDCFILSSLLNTLTPGSLIIGAHRDRALNNVFLNAVALARNLSEKRIGLNLLRLGEDCPPMHELPETQRSVEVPGPLEIILPLLFGAVFSLVE